MSSSASEQKPLRSTAENCAHIKKLGYIKGKHVNLYGEHLELVSDPFVEGDYVAVHATSSRNQIVRTIDLPVSILAGWEDTVPEAAKLGASELIAETSPPGTPHKA